MRGQKDGISLPVVLAFMVVVALTAVALSHLISSRINEVSLTRLRFERDELAMDLTRDLYSRQSLRYSLSDELANSTTDVNEALRRCFFYGVGNHIKAIDPLYPYKYIYQVTPDCDNMAPTDWKPMALYSATDNLHHRITGLLKVPPAVDDPVYYNFEGVVCAPADKCPLEVLTAFQSICPPENCDDRNFPDGTGHLIPSVDRMGSDMRSGAQCPRALEIDVRLVVRTSPFYTGKPIAPYDQPIKRIKGYELWDRGWIVDQPPPMPETGDPDPLHPDDPLHPIAEEHICWRVGL